MQNPNTIHNPSLSADLGSLAGLYRTVFWMIGRKAKYGRLWPPGTELAVPDEERIVVAPPPAVEAHRPQLVEVTSKD